MIRRDYLTSTQDIVFVVCSVHIEHFLLVGHLLPNGKRQTSSAIGRMFDAMIPGFIEARFDQALEQNEP